MTVGRSLPSSFPETFLVLPYALPARNPIYRHPKLVLLYVKHPSVFLPLT
jgi:hypothetical protein